jgi:hypothetical protein
MSTVLETAGEEEEEANEDNQEIGEEEEEAEEEEEEEEEEEGGEGEEDENGEEGSVVAKTLEEELGNSDGALSPLAGVTFRPRVFVYDLVPTRAFLRAMLRALEAPPLQVPDGASPDCMGCRKPFNDLRWKHHCRFCARLLCSACTACKAPASAFPPAFLQGRTDAGSAAGSNSGTDSGAAAAGAAAASDVPLPPPPPPVKRLVPGSLKNPVCEDCHAVLTRAALGGRAPPGVLPKATPAAAATAAQLPPPAP